MHPEVKPALPLSLVGDAGGPILLDQKAIERGSPLALFVTGPIDQGIGVLFGRRPHVLRTVFSLLQRDTILPVELIIRLAQVLMREALQMTSLYPLGTILRFRIFLHSLA